MTFIDRVLKTGAYACVAVLISIAVFVAVSAAWAAPAEAAATATNHSRTEQPVSVRTAAQMGRRWAYRWCSLQNRKVTGGRAEVPLSYCTAWGLNPPSAWPNRLRRAADPLSGDGRGRTLVWLVHTRYAWRLSTQTSLLFDFNRAPCWKPLDPPGSSYVVRDRVSVQHLGNELTTRFAGRNCTRDTRVRA